MDRPPPYSEIDHSQSSSRTGSPTVGSSSHSPVAPSAPVSYNSGDAKIPFSSPRQSFSPPHLPPSPQSFSPPFLYYNTAPPLPEKIIPHRPDMGRSGCSSSSSASLPSLPRSPIAGPSSSSCFMAPPSCHSQQKQYQRYNSNEQWKKSTKRRPSSDSLSSSSSSSSTNSSKSSTTQQDDGGEKSKVTAETSQFGNRKSSVDMKETNKKLQWDGTYWFGKHFSMKTTNAKLDVQGTLDAKIVNLITTNALINWTGESILCKDLDIRTTNAKVELVGDKVEAKHGIKVKTSNAQLLFDKPVLSAKDISVITSNAEVRMLRAQVKRSLNCKTSNARVVLHIKPVVSRRKSKSPPKINVEVVTSNAPVIIHMPADFTGEFKLATSQNKAVIFDDPQEAVVYNPDKKASSRDGYRFKKNGGSLKVTTSQSDITIIFDQ